MESKSIFELNKAVQKSLTVIKERPEQLAPQDDFNAWILSRLNEMCLKFSKGRRRFEVTEENADFLSAVFAYLNRSEDDQALKYGNLSLDLDKGLLFMGNYGVGKTLLMRCIFENRSKLKLAGRFATAQNVFDCRLAKVPLVATQELVGKEMYSLWLDDIGEEPNVANNFGTHDTPVGNLLKVRVDAWEQLPEAPKLFLTTNCKEETLREVYGGRVVSRLYGACNVLVSKQKTDFRKV